MFSNEEREKKNTKVFIPLYQLYKPCPNTEKYIYVQHTDQLILQQITIFTTSKKESHQNCKTISLIIYGLCMDSRPLWRGVSAPTVTFGEVIADTPLSLCGEAKSCEAGRTEPRRKLGAGECAS